jgi:hypothetical protein
MSLHHRAPRVLASIGISSILLLGMMAAPAFARLAVVTVTATAVPGSVTPGANVAIDVEFYNFPSTSNISQLFLDAVTPPGWALVTVESYSQGSCTWSTDVHCTIGAVNAGAAFDARIVYTTPSNVTGSVALDWFLFHTTGVANDKGKNSHGDNYPTSGSVTLDNSKDFAGAYTSASGQLVSDSQALHSTRNPQYTAVNSPSGAIAVFVSESNEVDCPTGYTTCFGQWSHITVDYGATIDGGFSVILGYKGNIGNANFIHVLDDGSLEPITLTCSSPDEPNTIPCKWIETANGNTYATLWLTENGRIKAY